MNVERLLEASGQKDFLFKQKNFLQNEIDRINDLYKKNFKKKKEWKVKFVTLNEDYMDLKSKLEEEIELLKNRVIL